MAIQLFDPITQILDKLWLGTWITAAELRTKNPNGIKYVINCTFDPLPLTKNCGLLKVVNLGMDDGEDVPSGLVYESQMLIHDLIGIGPVLVNCHAGMSRSPAIVAAYLCRCGFGWDEAVDFIKSKRPQIMIHPRVSLSVRKALGLAPTESHKFSSVSQLPSPEGDGLGAGT